jgi:hypothetical protein
MANSVTLTKNQLKPPFLNLWRHALLFSRDGGWALSGTAESQTFRDSEWLGRPAAACPDDQTDGGEEFRHVA